MFTVKHIYDTTDDFAASMLKTRHVIRLTAQYVYMLSISGYAI